jgi:hypothetical protein
VFAGKGNGSKAAFHEAGMQVADIVTRGAEKDGGIRLMQAQEVDRRILDIGRRDEDRLISDVAVAAIRAARFEPQGIALIPFGERDDRARHGGGEEQCTPPFRRCIEQFLEIFAKAHVEHLVSFIEDGNLERRQV